MSRILLVFIFQSFCTSQILGNGDGRQNERFKFYFDTDVSFLNKAKSHFPEIPSKFPQKACLPMDCEELLRSGLNHSGVYTIWPRSRLTDGEPLEVYCDMDTDNGGWTVIQRRGNFNKSVDYFYENWSSYKNGFGGIQEDFWLGNDNIFALTNQRVYSIRFDLKDVHGKKTHALYDIFWIDDENQKYMLHIQNYSGNAGDSMTEMHDNQKFSTEDQDNDGKETKSCSQLHKGGWWYGGCYHANLNGLYLKGSNNPEEGINWRTSQGYYKSLGATEMKIRPMNFKRKKDFP